jgi:hypothetical protein
MLVLALFCHGTYAIRMSLPSVIGVASAFGASETGAGTGSAGFAAESVPPETVAPAATPPRVAGPVAGAGAAGAVVVSVGFGASVLVGASPAGVAAVSSFFLSFFLKIDLKVFFRRFIASGAT